MPVYIVKVHVEQEEQRRADVCSDPLAGSQRRGNGNRFGRKASADISFFVFTLLHLLYLLLRARTNDLTGAGSVQVEQMTVFVGIRRRPLRPHASFPTQSTRTLQACHHLPGIETSRSNN